MELLRARSQSERTWDLGFFSLARSADRVESVGFLQNPVFLGLQMGAPARGYIFSTNLGPRNVKMSLVLVYEIQKVA